MALLQAARYYLLYGDLEKAKSFGLNRAIFYAWAKYYGPSTGHYMLKRRVAAVPPKVREAMERLRRGEKGGLERFMAGRGREEPVVVDDEGRRWAILFDGYEAVPIGPHGWFEMGGKEQTPADFDRQVARSFEAVGVPFRIAWEAALDYLRRFPVEVLKSPSRFYKYVYEPVRDSFIDAVVRPYVERLEGSEGRGEKVEETREATSGAVEHERRAGVEKREGGRREAGVKRPFRTLDEFLRRSDSK